MGADDQVRRIAKPELLYNDKFRSHIDGSYRWDRDMPIYRMPNPSNILSQLNKALATGLEEDDGQDEPMPGESMDETQHLERRSMRSSSRIGAQFNWANYEQSEDQEPWAKEMSR